MEGEEGERGRARRVTMRNVTRESLLGLTWSRPTQSKTQMASNGVHDWEEVQVSAVRLEYVSICPAIVLGAF